MQQHKLEQSPLTVRNQILELSLDSDHNLSDISSHDELKEEEIFRSVRSTGKDEGQQQNEQVFKTPVINDVRNQKAFQNSMSHNKDGFYDSSKTGYNFMNTQSNKKLNLVCDFRNVTNANNYNNQNAVNEGFQDENVENQEQDQMQQIGRLQITPDIYQQLNQSSHDYQGDQKRNRDGQLYQKVRKFNYQTPQQEYYEPFQLNPNAATDRNHQHHLNQEPDHVAQYYHAAQDNHQKPQHNRAQTTELDQFKQKLPALVNRQLKNKHSMNIKLEDNNNVIAKEIQKNMNKNISNFNMNQSPKNEFVKAQQNNLFTASMPPKYKKRKTDGMQSKDSADNLNFDPDHQKNNISDHKQLVSNLVQQNTIKGSSTSSILKKKAELITKGYDFSSIILDPHNAQNYANFVHAEDDSNRNRIITKKTIIEYMNGTGSNIFSQSGNQSILHALFNYDPENKVMEPSFMGLKAQNEEQPPVEVQQLVEDEKEVINNQNQQQEMQPSDLKSSQESGIDATIIDMSELESLNPIDCGLKVKFIIENSTLNQTLILPDSHIKIKDLVIDKPLTIKGKPGTILEITHGCIEVNFGENEKYKDVFSLCECHVLYSDRADLIFIKEELEKEDINNNLNSNNILNSHRGYTTAPTKLSTELIRGQILKIKSPPSENEYIETDQNRLQTEGTQNGSKKNLLFNKDPSNDKIGGGPGTNNVQMSVSDNTNSVYPLFQIKNYSYVEIRDCLISSKNKQSVMDVAFCLNEKDENDSDLAKQYKGILSVKSCNIQNFSLAFLAGSNSILSVELSHITNVRQGAIAVVNPKILKVSGTVIDTIMGNGIQILFKNIKMNVIKRGSVLTSKVSSMSLSNLGSTSQREIIKKVYIEDNKIINCKESGIFIRSIVPDQMKVGSNQKYPRINAIIKIQKNKIYQNKYCGLHLNKIHLHQIEVNNCEFYQNQFANILLDKAQGQNVDLFTILRCKIWSSLENGLIIKDSHNITIHECEFIKNKLSGIYLFDTGAIKYSKKRKMIQQQLMNTSQQLISNITQQNKKGDIFELNNESNIDENNIHNDSIREVIRMKQENLDTNQIIGGGRNLTMQSSFRRGTINYNQATTQQPNSQSNTKNGMPRIQLNGLNINKTSKLDSLAGGPCDNVEIGFIRIIKCKFIDNKQNGMSIEDLYKKTVDIQSCKFKENYLNGISIYQELDTEDELRANFDSQSFLSNPSSPRQKSNHLFTNYQSQNNLKNNPKFLIIRRDILSYAKINIMNCEIILNKHYGLLLGHTRTLIKGSLISDNMIGAIRIPNLNVKFLIRLMDYNQNNSRGNSGNNIELIQKDRPAILGKVGGDWGEIINVYKELQMKSGSDISDLSRMLDDINYKHGAEENPDQNDKNSKHDQERNNNNIEILNIKEGTQKKTKYQSQASSKKSKFNCFQKQEKKRIEQIGDYLIIKEVDKRGTSTNIEKRNQLGQINDGKSRNGCNLMKCCTSTSNSRKMSDKQTSPKRQKYKMQSEQNCTIF
ncbi:UNKNOWN [Stylonychia lemnae]|uniref:Right handed beta helix domain-containing protein n=1 Tax=Stylonychia lemnae TaxID=5949 RepID=A0A077ZWL3_STYLE|nr:UNKNOWN [Stylonychia lemnae]|eukprot:CDW73677.1 UNKNOWN [Stylonychia lemnae]